MRLKLIAAIGAACLACAGIVVLLLGESNFEVYTDGDALFYRGVITPSGLEAMRSALDENPGIDTIEINSLGGDTIAGKGMGMLVHDRKMSVIVDTVCFSSCANYVFPSGVQKHIKENGVVGWHGSELQFETLAQINNVSVEESIKSAIKEGYDSNPLLSYSDQDIQREYDRLVQGLDAEKQFFEMIRIDPDLTLNGLYLVEDSQCIGWTHSIDDMAKYGVTDVQYLSDESYPDQTILEEFDLCLI